MIEQRTTSHARGVGSMVSSDDLKLYQKRNGAEPRRCAAGSDCVMCKHSKDGSPQQLRRAQANAFCEACRQSDKAPVYETLRTVGHRTYTRPRPRSTYSPDAIVQQALCFREENGYLPRYADFDNPLRPVYLCSTRAVQRHHGSIGALHAACKRALARRP